VTLRPAARRIGAGRLGALRLPVVAALALLMAWVAAPLVAQTAADPASTPAPPSGGDRSRELLDYRCASQLGIRQVTLFANGTVRVREGLIKSQTMTLGEVGPVELGGYLRRLAAEDLSEVHDTQGGTQGDWIERCVFRLTLDDQPARELTFGRYDSLPLQVAAVVRVADELAALTRPVSDLLPGYKPRVGDVLRRADGVLFEVVSFTGDGKGLEMQGVDQPLTLFAIPEDLPKLFTELVSRRR
jgi:hypothetical protein